MYFQLTVFCVYLDVKLDSIVSSRRIAKALLRLLTGHFPGEESRIAH